MCQSCFMYVVSGIMYFDLEMVDHSLCIYFQETVRDSYSYFINCIIKVS